MEVRLTHAHNLICCGGEPQPIKMLASMAHPQRDLCVWAGRGGHVDPQKSLHEIAEGLCGLMEGSI